MTFEEATRAAEMLNCRTYAENATVVKRRENPDVCGVKVTRAADGSQHVYVSFETIEKIIENEDREERERNAIFACLDSHDRPKFCDQNTWQDWIKQNQERRTFRINRSWGWEIRTAFHGKSLEQDGPPKFWVSWVTTFDDDNNWPIGHESENFVTLKEALALHEWASASANASASFPASGLTSRREADRSVSAGQARPLTSTPMAIKRPSGFRARVSATEPSGGSSAILAQPARATQGAVTAAHILYLVIIALVILWIIMTHLH